MPSHAELLRALSFAQPKGPHIQVTAVLKRKDGVIEAPGAVANIIGNIAS